MATPNFQPLPPQEAIKWFRQKGYAVGFSWKDIWQEEHAAAFTVAKAMNLQVLETLRQAVDQAIEDGQTLAQFRKGLEPTLKKLGWWGEGFVHDPETGELVKARLGSARRLSIIYDTNLRMAHAAGRWQKAVELAKSQAARGRATYLWYRAVLDERTRPQHRAWHDIVLPVDHAFWDTHYPPNGWRCRCIVRTLTERELQRRGLQASPPPRIRRRKWVNNRTGEVHQVPAGIDPGFGYNVGKARLRGLTPPPLGGLPQTFPQGRGLPRLPDPTPVSADMILADDLADEDYLKAFLSPFKATLNKGVIFTDKSGWPVTISADLFRTFDGRGKIRKGGRHLYARLLADAIRDPDEIWWIWAHDERGGWQLRRRFLKRWDIDGRREHGLAVFEYGQDGWLGTTLFQAGQRSEAARDRYFERQRGELLLYRR